MINKLTPENIGYTFKISKKFDLEKMSFMNQEINFQDGSLLINIFIIYINASK